MGRDGVFGPLTGLGASGATSVALSPSGRPRRHTSPPCPPPGTPGAPGSPRTRPWPWRPPRRRCSAFPWKEVDAWRFPAGRGIRPRGRSENKAACHLWGRLLQATLGGSSSGRGQPGSAGTRSRTMPMSTDGGPLGRELDDAAPGARSSALRPGAPTRGSGAPGASQTVGRPGAQRTRSRSARACFKGERRGLAPVGPQAPGEPIGRGFARSGSPVASRSTAPPSAGGSSRSSCRRAGAEGRRLSRPAGRAL